MRKQRRPSAYDPNRPPKLSNAGRPPAVDAAAKAKVCQRVAMGRTLTSVLADSDLPSRDVVNEALTHDPEFAAALVRAREQSAHYLAAETVDIADTARDTRWRIESRWRLAGRYNSQYSEKASGVNVQISLERLITDAAGSLQVEQSSLTIEHDASELPKDTR